MFPFKTNKKKIFTKLGDKEIKTCLKAYIKQSQLIEIGSDYEFIGKIESLFAKFGLGQWPSRNAFRPIVVMKWYNNGKNTEINSYLRLDIRIIFASFIPFLSGIYFSIEQNMIMPLIITFFLTLLLLIFSNIFYRYSMDLTINKLDVILEDLSSDL